MDIKDLKTLIKMVTETDITEFEMESEQEKIIIKRGSSEVVTYAAAPSYAVAPSQPVAPVAAALAPVAAPVAAVPAAGGDKGELITSPIIGTFYAAPSPESDAYVKVGSIVEKGQTLCIVEAMKLMNEIEAEFKCKIVEILAENAKPVEYGAPLFRVERL